MNNDYRISNIYYMLSYAFDNGKLNELNKRKVDVEKFDNIYDLFSSILIILVNKLIKKGLIKDYILEIDELNYKKGKIIIHETLKKSFKRTLVCEYDEFSSNNYLNRIIKSTLFFLISSNKLSSSYKKNIKKTYLELQNIELLDIKTINWKSIKYNKGNINYKYIINLCYLILNGLLINESKGKIEFVDFIDEQSMNVLFEKFIREYLKKNFPELNPRITQMSWSIDEGYMIDFIPKMITDITLSYKNKIMIIDTKYYSKIFNSKGFNGYDSKTINRDNWNQINAYVANASYNNDKKVSGMLLYAKTDEDISPDISTSVMGNKIFVKTIDLTKQKFIEIEKQIQQIANSFKEDI